MQVVILAAGQGSRLGRTTPKPLTPLADGQSILARQLEALSAVVSLDRVMLVVGYQKQLIMEAFPDLLYVFNPSFAEENTAKSLLRALPKVEDDLLWLNGDVVFQPELLPDLIQAGGSALMVNQTSVGEEEVKYRCDPLGRICEVSKEVEGAEGESLGINFFCREDLPLLQDCLTRCEDQDYFEKGIEMALSKGLVLWPKVVPVDACVEVDFPQDLAQANQLLTKWLGLPQ